ncbi:MAG: DUF177 domain-containing protein [Hyphomicrobiales bacterium]|nr:DUF177 domain-containing protein [Hyphomicrobiales bacterium]
MPSDPGGEIPLRRLLDVRSAPAKGLRGAFTATSEERAALSAWFDLADLASLAVNYEIKPLDRGRARLIGRLRAEATQTCVATGEPVPASIDESFDVEFWPADQLGRAARELDIRAEDADPPEPMIDGRIDAGAFAAELLGVSLDPYPRKPGAEFAPVETPEDAAGANPFAVLASVRGGDKSR